MDICNRTVILLDVVKLTCGLVGGELDFLYKGDDTLSVLVMTIILPLIYLAIIGLIVWYAFKFLSLQKERNEILKEISHKLDKKDE